MKPKTIAVSIHHEDETGNIITLLDNLTVIYDYRVITVPSGFIFPSLTV